jgi:hypothetical protein
MSAVFFDLVTGVDRYSELISHLAAPNYIAHTTPFYYNFSTVIPDELDQGAPLWRNVVYVRSSACITGTSRGSVLSHTPPAFSVSEPLSYLWDICT